MTNEPTLPQRKTYGSFVREVEPGRHVYRTTVTLGRWFMGLAILAGAVFFAWVAHGTFETGHRAPGPFEYGLGGFFWLGGAVLAYGAVSVVAFSTRVVITPKSCHIASRWYAFQPNDVLISDIGDVIGASVDGLPTFHPGGSTPVYCVVVERNRGSSVSLRASIDELDDARALADDMTESIRLAIEQPDAFLTPSSRVA